MVKGFNVDSLETNKKVDINLICEKNGLSIYEITIFDNNLDRKIAKHEEKESIDSCIPDSSMKKDSSPVLISWQQPMIDGYSVWMPMARRNRCMSQWNGNINNSAFYCGAPILSLIRNNGLINTTVALLDCLSPVKITFGVDDFHQNDEFSFRIYISTSPDTKFYKTYLRIDKREINLVDSIGDVAQWWKDELKINYSIPEGAEDALYSSWYNFHQEPDQILLEKEFVKAKEIGLKTAILDDGWQFSGKGTNDYSLCGDWKISKEKFPDFKGFVKKAHDCGLKLLVWFPVPFVGIHTKDYIKFSDKLLTKNSMGAGVLDVRYKECRNYIINIYKNFVLDYDIDGLKLDFIDSFKIYNDSSEYNDKMDFENVEDAVKCLMDSITVELNKIKKNFLIEFRQYYIGAEIVRHCNMLRVIDCAYDSITNRIGIMDIRMLDKFVATHADMLLWAKKENPVIATRQLLNIMFGVPQISVLLTKCDPSHLLILKNFISYWTENSKILLHGKLSFKDLEANFSSISSEDDKKKITVLYSDNFHIVGSKDEDIFNATNIEFISIDLIKDCLIEILDCFGNIIDKKQLNNGTYKINVPLCGSLRIR